MTQAIILYKMEVPTEAKVPRTNEEFCIGCGVCVRVCPIEGVIKLVEEEVLPGVIVAKAGMPVSVEEIMVSIAPSVTCPLPEYCVNCRKCVEECPSGARTFQPYA